jgi:hypothetical protein
MSRFQNFAAIVVATIISLESAAVVSAKPERAPIRVESSVPANVKTGDEVTTTITLRALADVDRVEVSIAPFKGLVLLSDTKDAVFTGMKAGEGRPITVTIRLTDPMFGSLAVTYKTRQGTRDDAGAATILFGAPR